MFKLEELKKQYDKKPVTEIVNQIKTLDKTMKAQAKELVQVLWYLEKTRRWVEVPGYEKQEFRVFLFEVCHISYHRYYQIRSAYHWFPEESEQLGPHVVQMIRTKVGPAKAKVVIEDVKKKLAKTKDKGKERKIIAEVVEKYAPKKKTDGDTKAYWKARAMQLEEENKRLKEINKELTKEIEKLREQLNKQKPIVEDYLKWKNHGTTFCIDDKTLPRNPVFKYEKLNP